MPVPGVRITRLWTVRLPPSLLDARARRPDKSYAKATSCVFCQKRVGAYNRRAQSGNISRALARIQGERKGRDVHIRGHIQTIAQGRVR